MPKQYSFLMEGLLGSGDGIKTILNGIRKRGLKKTLERNKRASEKMHVYNVKKPGPLSQDLSMNRYLTGNW